MDQENQVTRLSIALVSGVLLIKLITAFFVQSVSFLAELSDAILDIIQVGITFFALKYSRRPPDADHMFGHTKINSLAGFVESLIIIGLYGGIGYSSIRKMIVEPNYTTENGWLGSLSLILIMAGVFIVSRKIVQIGKKTNNQVIIAQGLNFRSDFYRNIAVIIGLALSFILQIGWIDLILALIVSIYTIYEGIGVLRHSCNELLDANAFTEDLIQDVRNHLEEINQVRQIDNLAIRTVGKQLDAVLGLFVEHNFPSTKFEEIAAQVNEIFRTHFPTMEINMNLQINIDQIASNGLDSHDVFNLLRSIPLVEYDVADLHNIKIDNFPKEILIQFHIRINPDYTIALAHRNAHLLELHIKKMITQYHPEKEIRVISHIETDIPISHHQTEPEESSNIEKLYEFIKEISIQNSESVIFQSINILPQTKGIRVIIVAQFIPTLILSEVEEIMDEIEDKLYQSSFDVKSVLIHPEPK